MYVKVKMTKIIKQIKYMTREIQKFHKSNIARDFDLKSSIKVVGN